MGAMKEEYALRNISVIDHTDGSGDVIAMTSVATLFDDLVFLFGTGPDDTECPKVYEACRELAKAYADGDPCDEYTDFLRIELRMV